MAGDDPRGAERPRSRAWAAGIDDARRRARLAMPDGVAAAAERWRRILADWVAAELTPGRLAPWLPIAFGFGIVLYFTAEREPLWWAVFALAVGASAVAIMLRRRPAAFPVALGFAAIAIGFAVATLHTARIAHPVLTFPTWTARVTGFVEMREERARSDRIVVRVQRIDVGRRNARPVRVRVAVRKGTAPEVGSFVEFKAYLAPPLQPLRPGGYDFARDMYFQRIGASGYVLGRIATVPAPHAPDASLRAAATIDGMRDGITTRIQSVLPGDRGAIASALITGKRNAIPELVRDTFYISSLAHVLAISGFHMAVVAGIVFFAIRAGLALAPALAIRRPIKKWAAAAALVSAAFYLVLSGAGVSTQRAFIMTAIVLVGVMLDRPALTFRTLAVAAFAVLLLAPQAVVHPSFQMSFAATLALIAAYQRGIGWRASADTAFGARVALWGWREIVGLLLVSLVAGLATTPYAAYHFHRLAPYGLIANLLAMPVVSAWVMPMGILGVLTMPFGFDAPFWRAMGLGLDWMMTVALWVSGLPGAVGHIHAFGSGPLLLGTAGLLLMCLLRTHLRWSGAVLAAGACLWVMATPRHDVLIAGDGQAAALRGTDGRLRVLQAGRDTFAIKEWLAADGDSRTPDDKSLSEGIRCDAIGCVGTLQDGRLVAFAREVEAFAEDCARASVVISPRVAQAACAATLIDRNDWRGKGAISLRWNGHVFEEKAARPAGLARPWARGPREIEEATGAGPANSDATPPATALDADD